MSNDPSVETSTAACMLPMASMEQCDVVLTRVHTLLQVRIVGIMWVSLSDDASDGHNRTIAILLLLFACMRGVFIAVDSVSTSLPSPVRHAFDFLDAHGLPAYTAKVKKASSGYDKDLIVHTTCKPLSEKLSTNGGQAEEGPSKQSGVIHKSGIARV